MSGSKTIASTGSSDATVLWCHSHFLLPTGGTKYIFEVARRLAEKRRVEMVVERASDYWRERYAAAGIPLHEISSSTSTSKLYWLTFPVHLIRDRKRLGELIARTGASHLISSFFPFNLLCSQLGERHGIRHTHLCFEPFPFFHDREVQNLYPPAQRWLMRILDVLYGGLDRRGVNDADEVLTLNSVTRDAIASTYGRRDATPVFAGIDHEHFHPYSESALRDLRQRHGEGPFVIHSTDFSPIKRTDLALAAFAEARKHTKSKLLVTSTIDDKRSLEAFWKQARRLGVEQDVEFLGFVSYDDLPRYYALATVLLQTGTSVNSGATSMSLPVKEALACSTAVIRSRATDEDVIDGVSGYLVDPEDVAFTGARISELLQDAEKAKRFGAAGHELMRELYSWNKVVDLFDSSIAERASAATVDGP